VIINGEKKHVMGYMKDFLFQPEQARTPVGKLSGGERGRLAGPRAGAALEPAGARRADQRSRPRNARPAAGNAVDYPGTVIVVSHDRDFLDRVATSVIVAEGDGKLEEYAGGYSDMVAQRGFGVA
jgi:ATP-binding cassette subfamily F protein uup